MSKTDISEARPPRVTAELVEAAIRRGRLERSKAFHGMVRRLFSRKRVPDGGVATRPHALGMGAAGLAGRC